MLLVFDLELVRLLEGHRERGRRSNPLRPAPDSDAGPLSSKLPA